MNTLVLLLLKPAAPCQVGKTKSFIFATPRAPAPRKTEKQTQGTQGKLRERLTAPLHTSQAAGNLSICVNFKVFSFVMMYNNKKNGAIFGCHITFCVITQYI